MTTKTTVFHKRFPFDFKFAKENPKRLIAWLYENQSTSRRHHLGNRLFVILKSDIQDDWKLKAELGLIKKEVYKYIENFDKDNLITMKFPNNTIYTDVIFVEETF